MSDVVTLEHVIDAVLLVKIDRQEARNAINGEVTAALDAAVCQSERDDRVRVVILTGAGDRAFCAGADLKVLGTAGRDQLHTRVGGFAGLVNYPRTKPWIAAVNGAALAGGCELALACDIIICCDTATFGLPEVRRGLIAAAGGVYRLVRALPRSLAMEALLTGAPLSASVALSAGLVSRVVAASQLQQEAISLARTIASNAPLAVRETLGIARQAWDRADAELAVLSVAASSRLVGSEDFAEGVRAFIEKREPQWIGR